MLHALRLNGIRCCCLEFEINCHGRLDPFIVERVMDQKFAVFVIIRLF